MDSYLLYVKLQLHSEISQRPINHSNIATRQDTI